MKKHPFLHFALLVIFLASFSSCINLRYTDYGRPFDFLKAKNQSFHSHKIKKDTAGIFVSNQLTSSDFNQNEITFDKGDVILVDTSSAILKPQKKLVIVEEYDNKQQLKLAKTIQASNIENDDIIIENYKSKPHLKSTSKNAISLSPKGWWEDFWEGFWNFVLKWLLIFLLFFVILALVIWGIYLLITLIGGPVAGGIFLLIVCLLFYILVHT